MPISPHDPEEYGVDVDVASISIVKTITDDSEEVHVEYKNVESLLEALSMIGYAWATVKEDFDSFELDAMRSSDGGTQHEIGESQD